jgi:predicted signal transduction protein with EAL and GGDEF domain
LPLLFPSVLSDPAGVRGVEIRAEGDQGIVIDEHHHHLGNQEGQLSHAGGQTCKRSLRYLQRLPIDGLKIDSSFIRCMGNEGENQEIVKTILMLAQDLDVAVIAEGEETVSQLTRIQSLNREFGQGFLFSRPVGSDQAKTLIGAKPVL